MCLSRWAELGAFWGGRECLLLGVSLLVSPSLWESRRRYRGLAETASEEWASQGDSQACEGWGSLSSSDWKHIAAGDREVFSLPTDVHMWGKHWAAEKQGQELT